VSAIADPAHALTPSGNLVRRQFVSRLVLAGAVGAAALAVAVLGILVFYTGLKGAGQLSLTFFTGQLPSYNGVGGGLGPALVGTDRAVAVRDGHRAPDRRHDGVVRVGVRSAAGGSGAGDRARPDGRNASIIIGVFVVLLIVDNSSSR